MKPVTKYTLGICAILLLAFLERNNFPLSKLNLLSNPAATESSVVELKDGDTYTLTASYVKKIIKGHEIQMLAYNGSIPGPTIKVAQGSTITIHFVNKLTVPTTMHSHGVRLDNKFDGVPGVTQPEIEPNGTFDYTIKFPDTGIFWYHPHINEPYEQQMGLYGNFIVTPKDTAHFEPVNREVPIILSDILLDPKGDVVPFPKTGTNYTLMGRYGNVLLTNGTTSYALSAQKGEVVRLYLTNASNARPYNFTIPNVKMKLIGADNGAYERETYVSSIILGPSERAIVDIYFPNEGIYTLNNKTPSINYHLGDITVTSNVTSSSYVTRFNTLLSNKTALNDFTSLKRYIYKASDKKITLSMDAGSMGQMGAHMMGNGSMMMGAMGGSSSGAAHVMPDGTVMGGGMMMGGHVGDIEWEDTMAMMNSMSTQDTVKWKIIDQETGATNDEIDWKFKLDSKIKITIYNDPNGMHVMQHPIHFHGQRFVVLSTNGIPNTNMAWKDTTLVKAGDTVDILLEVSNQGDWMAHCHVAEHLSDGMMINFTVEK